MLPDSGPIFRSRQHFFVERSPGVPAAGTPPARAPQVRIACLADDSNGGELRALWKREVCIHLRKSSCNAPNGFEAPKPSTRPPAPDMPYLLGAKK